MTPITYTLIGMLLGFYLSLSIGYYLQLKRTPKRFRRRNPALEAFVLWWFGIEIVR